MYPKTYKTGRFKLLQYLYLAKLERRFAILSLRKNRDNESDQNAEYVDDPIGHVLSRDIILCLIILMIPNIQTGWDEFSFHFSIRPPSP